VGAVWGTRAGDLPPEARGIWQYAKWTYENVDKLTAFTIDDFARGFAGDHDLDMKLRRDIESEQPAISC
jgi:hypothetical protein